MSPEELDQARTIAKTLHETYVKLAPNYGITLMLHNWENLPESNKLLLVGVIADLLDKKVIAKGEL